MARATRQGAEREHRRSRGEPVFTGWCLDKEDLCVAKICAFREKDREFVRDLVAVGLVDREVITDRLVSVPERYASAAATAADWLLTL